MSDKLEWRNRHALLFQYRTVQDAVRLGQYKLSSAVEPFLTMDPMACEDFATALMAADRHKEVCEFLAYAMQRRPAVWWGYRALLTLREEMIANPPTMRDIADIGKPKPLAIPEWARMPDLEAQAAAAEAAGEKNAAEMMKDVTALVEDLRASLPEKDVFLWDSCMKTVDDAFKAEHGLTMMELLRKAAEQAAGPDFTVSDASPIFQEVAKLKAQIEQSRQQTIATVKAVVPPVDIKLKTKQGAEAAQAVYRWIVAPDAVNTKLAFDAGNACPDLPVGLLALTAAWSFGDMAPTGDIKVPTPPGLSANGLSNVLLKAALAKGGTRKLLERFKLYAEIGINVVRGADLWGESVEKEEPPHASLLDPSAVPPSAEALVGSPSSAPLDVPVPPKLPTAASRSSYVKWNPRSPGGRSPAAT